MSPGSAARESSAAARTSAPTCSITGSGPATGARAAQRFEIVIAGDGLRQPDLDADDPLAMLRHRRRAAATSAASMFSSSPPAATPVRATFRKMRTRLGAACATRTSASILSDAGRSAVDHRRDAVAQQHRRRHVGRADVHVQIDQPRGDDLAARVEDVGRLRRRDPRPDCRGCVQRRSRRRRHDRLDGPGRGRGRP